MIIVEVAPLAKKQIAKIVGLDPSAAMPIAGTLEGLKDGSISVPRFVKSHHVFVEFTSYHFVVDADTDWITKEKYISVEQCV